MRANPFVRVTTGTGAVLCMAAGHPALGGLLTALAFGHDVLAVAAIIALIRQVEPRHRPDLVAALVHRPIVRASRERRPKRRRV